MRSRMRRAPTRRWRILPRSGFRRDRTGLRGFSYAKNVRENPCGMVARIDLIVNFFDHAVLVDQKTHAVGISRGRSRACAVRDRDCVIGITHQRKFELMCFSKRSVAFWRVETDAGDADIVFVEIRLMVTKAASLESTSGGAGLDEKP